MSEAMCFWMLTSFGSPARTDAFIAKRVCCCGNCTYGAVVTSLALRAADNGVGRQRVRARLVWPAAARWES